VNKYLPGTNYKKCGENSCLALAVKLIDEKTNILSCKEIFLLQYEGRRKILFNILKSSGYKVPDF